MGNLGGHGMLDGRDVDFELLRRAFPALAQGHLVQAGEDGRQFLRRLERSISEAAAMVEPDRLDAKPSADFDRATARVQAVLQEALQSRGPE